MKGIDVNYTSPIFEWDMTPQEVEAYRLAVIYDQEFRKEFGATADGMMVRMNTIPKRGDPRKSYLFKHCWKLRRETRGLVEEHEYPLYIRANLQVLKINKARIEPNGICGDKAWIRWRMWKRWYDEKMSDTAAEAPSPSVSTTDPKLIREIDGTKKFMFERCEGEPTRDKIKTFVENGFFKLWVASGKVCHTYVVLSPFVAKSCDLKKLAADCSFSIDLAKQFITEEVEKYFKHEFKHEYAG